MKRKIYLALLFCLAAAILLTGLAGCGEKEEKDPDEETHLVGGYSQDRALTEEDMEVFNQALEGFTGVAYEPTLVATQVVAGLNYRFTTIATPVIPEPYSYPAYVYIFKPLSGPPELVKVEKIPAPDEDRSELYAGQWHAMNAVAAGFDERWLFEEDGAFVFGTSDMDALGRLLFEAGQWKVLGSELQLTVESRVELVGGTVVASDEGDYIDGAEVQVTDVGPPEQVTHVLGGFGTDEETGRRTITIDGVTFYDFGNQDDLFDSYYELTGTPGG